MKRITITVDDDRDIARIACVPQAICDLNKYNKELGSKECGFSFSDGSFAVCKYTKSGYSFRIWGRGEND